MTARPILFSGPMVRALLEGRKTQTRRAVKPLTKRHPIQNLAIDGVSHDRNYSGKHDDPESWGFVAAEDGCDMALADWVGVLCPYGKPGDLLWVRETISRSTTTPGYMAYSADDQLVYDGERGWPSSIERRKTIVSIHMPRWASRLTLRITDVRVQRLADISEADAIAEGITLPPGPGYGPIVRSTFTVLWDSINGQGSFDSSPWIWALTFDVIKANVDQVSQ